MKNTLMSTMLATNDFASALGCRLKPKLHAAIEADLRFPAHAASPMSEQTPEDLPENVVKLSQALPERERTAS
ncbi:hypothetical protein [Ruegeria sp. MALMAid1280]|uniref:hypothetical protein n=1 Tax=Ruegeria sp. MALMAid1280 TaxID=3411634 RepID=UPI003B9FA799